MSRTPLVRKDPIAARNQEQFEAPKRADAAALAELFCEDAILMAPNETTLYGRSEVREWWEEYFKNFRITALATTEREVTMLGEWVIERIAYTIAITPVAGGERIRDDSRWFAVWRLDSDGVWRVYN